MRIHNWSTFTCPHFHVLHFQRPPSQTYRMLKLPQPPPSVYHSESSALVSWHTTTTTSTCSQYIKSTTESLEVQLDDSTRPGWHVPAADRSLTTSSLSRPTRCLMVSHVLSPSHSLLCLHHQHQYVYSPKIAHRHSHHRTRCSVYTTSVSTFIAQR